MKRHYDILVTDSRYKHALSIVRGLGKEGLRIATCSEGFSPTRFSKYSKKSFKYTRKNFQNKLLNFLNKNDVSLVLPVGYFTNKECSKIKKEIENNSKIILSDFHLINSISRKDYLKKVLNKFKMLYPKTWIIKRVSDVEKIKGKNFVIKSALEEKGKKVEYASSNKELKKFLSNRLSFGTQIVQEHISGEGRGFFAFCYKGTCLQTFQHKRIRQYPESGGVSSCAESIYDKTLEKISKGFLKKLNWTGPVMLEYIYNQEKRKYYFIEMNAKFWGSYDLSIFCGLNFGKIPFDLIKGKKIKNKKYPLGKKFQWILPEDTLRIKTSKKKSLAKKEWKRDLLDRSIGKDIQYLFNDPLPTLIRIFSTIWKYFFKK
ncbi:hypothetical protein GW932_01260 [archaeon]|nr:hypothetical protein [archaeon]